MAQQRKIRAVESLLRAASISAAAEESGVSRRTLQRWMQDRSFREQLRKAKAQAFDLAQGRLCAAANEAVNILLDALRGEQVSRLQFLSARAVIEAGQQAHEDDIEARVERLEKLAAEQANDETGA